MDSSSMPSMILLALVSVLLSVDHNAALELNADWLTCMNQTTFLVQVVQSQEEIE
jgi:hypothetical protein